jgi:hypothetical protein
MTEDMLRNAQVGERVLVQMQVMRHDPLGEGLYLGTVDPVDGHVIGLNFFSYKEAVAIKKESYDDDSHPWTVCQYTGEHGTFWAVEKGLNHRAAAFYRHEMPDAEKVALAVRDKLNYFWQLLGKEEY